MRGRPILFSAPMVRAILDGRKTQTRRVVQPQPAALCRYEMNGSGTHALHLGPPMSPGETMSSVPPTPTSMDHKLPCPYGAPGDRMWVKETIRWSSTWGNRDYAVFAADGEHTLLDTWPWQRKVLPSIYMPRGLSRITLEVTGVRVERLHAITEEDARSEGCLGMSGVVDVTPREEYEQLWKDINGAESWKANPWVWVVEFRQTTKERGEG